MNGSPWWIARLNWSAKITSCMSDPTAGGMGFHYGNVGLIDGAVSVDQPEMEVVEPEKNRGLCQIAITHCFVPLASSLRSQVSCADAVHMEISLFSTKICQSPTVVV